MCAIKCVNLSLSLGRASSPNWHDKQGVTCEYEEDNFSLARPDLEQCAWHHPLQFIIIKEAISHDYITRVVLLNKRT